MKRKIKITETQLRNIRRSLSEQSQEQRNSSDEDRPKTGQNGAIELFFESKKNTKTINENKLKNIIRKTLIEQSQPTTPVDCIKSKLSTVLSPEEINSVMEKCVNNKDVFGCGSLLFSLGMQKGSKVKDAIESCMSNNKSQVSY
jgi:signal recognition particle receptor subunit beta